MPLELTLSSGAHSVRASIVFLVLLNLVPAQLGLTVQQAALENGVHLSGRITGLRGNDHVIVRADGPETARTTTRSEGRWTIENLAAGRYTVTPIHARYVFKPEDRRVEVGNRAIRDIDFEASAIESP